MAWPDALSEVSEERCYELYHENSKIGRRVRPLPLMPLPGTGVWERDGDQYPLFAIGEADPAVNPLGAAAGRAPGPPQSGRLSIKLLAALLAPPASADGDLIDLFFHVRSVDGLPAGLYRFGVKGAARLIRRGDLGNEIGKMLTAPEAVRVPLQVVIAGAFARAAQASGERGYRRALIAAGARARTIELSAAALGLGLAATTEFYDRELDAFLGLDGVDSGALVLIAVGPAA
jgi:SagB-type dehydrogenase family enzyme